MTAVQARPRPAPRRAPAPGARRKTAQRKTTRRPAKRKNVTLLGRLAWLNARLSQRTRIKLGIVAACLVLPVSATLWRGDLQRALSLPIAYPGQIAPLFTPEVQRWGDSIRRWAEAKGIDPNLLATVMQIESCGDADISSSAGAQGLFQVMPFHFAPGEEMTDPDTNARRSTDFLAYCLDYANGSPLLALACYNGGPSVVNRDFSTWPNETQRYYVWGGTIYADALQNLSHSGSLDTWLNAGGAGLCAIARQD